MLKSCLWHLLSNCRKHWEVPTETFTGEVGCPQVSHRSQHWNSGFEDYWHRVRTWEMQKRNEFESLTHAGVAGFDVGGDKIWSTLDFGISKKFDRPACGSESKRVVYNCFSCSEILCFKYGHSYERNGFLRELTQNTLKMSKKIDPTFLRTCKIC